MKRESGLIETVLAGRDTEELCGGKISTVATAADELIFQSELLPGSLNISLRGISISIRFQCKLAQKSQRGAHLCRCSKREASGVLNARAPRCNICALGVQSAFSIKATHTHAIDFVCS